MKKFLAIILSCMMVTALFAGCKGDDRYINSEFLPEDVYLGRCYETKDKSIGWGKYQKNLNELGSNCVEIYVGYIPRTETEEDFEKRVGMLKEELDVLGSEYALAYYGENGDFIDVTIDTRKLGLPTFAIMNADYSYENKIVSQMGDLSIENIENFNYRVTEDLKLEVTVDIPEDDREKFENFVKENVGTMLYLKIGDLTFSATAITENMASDTVTFKGLLFLGSDVDESEYQFIGRITQHAVNVKNEGMYNIGFSTALEDGEENNYPVKYITNMDECVIANLNSLYDDTEFERYDVENRIRIRFNVDIGVVSDDDCLDRVEEVFALCEFDAGAYSEISFTWPSEEEGYNDYVIFAKRNGKMICTGYSDRMKGTVTNHHFTKNYMAN